MALRPLPVIVFATLVMSCQALFSVDQYEPGPDASVAPDASGGGGAATVVSSSGATGAGHPGGGGAGGTCDPPLGSGGGASGECPGSVMAKIAFADGKLYCIDRTEVTRAMYKKWLSTCPSPTGQPKACDWNTSFAPTLDNGANCDSSLHGLDMHPDFPVVCIDWCDALAYCKAQGKHLCGHKDGGALAFGQVADVTVSEWFNACTDQGTNDYPYGDTYDGLACVGDDFDMMPGDGALDDANAVGTAPGCVVPNRGLYDLSGNVWEWENSCAASLGPDDKCRHRGGSFWDPGGDLRCDSANPAGLHKRSQFNKNVGFRCCADVNP